MYIPKQYDIEDRDTINTFVEANGFGELISVDKGTPQITHMPFMFNHDKSMLLAHIARQNPHWKVLDNQSVLVVLNGPHDYISPNWYSIKSVPTWIYQTVHIKGTCRLFDDPERLQKTVDDLSRKYEAGMDDPWTPDYNPTMLKAIVGLEIEIEEIQCAFKLNQKKSIADRLEVAKQLEAQGNQALADAMRETMSEK